MISFGLVLVGEPRQLVVVEPLVVLAHAVGHDLVELAREVERMAVREVPAVGEVHAEDVSPGFSTAR